MAGTFRWGILGTGNIARQFCRDLQGLPGHDVHLVGSRSGDRAAAFVKEFGGTAADDYQGVLDDPGVDAIYLALPNTLHAEWTKKALHEGRHVLCEKPLATGVEDAEAMFKAAEKAGKLLVEGFMYRCHPQTLAIRDAIARGEIGGVTHVRASFCYRTTTIEGNVRFDAGLAGGALMDVGCYCLDAILQFGGADAADALALTRTHDRGVDVMTSGVVRLDNGVQGTFTCGLDTSVDNALIVAGTGGYLVADWPWKPQAGASFRIKHGAKPRQDLAPGEKAGPPPERTIEAPADAGLYALEARAFARAARGEAEPFMSRDDSLRLARLLARVRDAAGLNASP